MATDAYNEFTGLRQDGRRPAEMRNVTAQISTIPGCTGSSVFKMGQTEVIAQVFGPSEGKGERDAADIFVCVAFAEFAKAPHPSGAQAGRRSRESEAVLRRTFEAAVRREQYPGSRIDIAVTVVQDDGAFQSAAINAATLALIDAGVPMRDFVVSLTAAWIADRAFLDAARGEAGSRFPVLEIAVFPATRQIVTMSLAARVAPDAARALVALAVDGCLRLHRLLAAAVRADSAVRVGTVQHL